MACAGVAGAAEPLAAASGFNYGVISYTDIADTFIGSANAQLYGLSAINNAGQIAFSAMTASNVQHVDLTPVSSSTLINVADSTNLDSTSIVNTTGDA